MKQIVLITILLLHLFLISCSRNSASAGSQEEPVFSVQIKNLGDGFVFQHNDNTTIIDIESPTGIGSAIFTLNSGEMPRQINVRLHLKGLEEFRLISGQDTVVVSVPSGDGLSSQSQKKISGNSDLPMLPFDPLWLKVEIVSTSQNIPLDDGYFEIVIPKGFLEQSGNSFEIQWVDFFR